MQCNLRVLIQNYSKMYTNIFKTAPFIFIYFNTRQYIIIQFVSHSFPGDGCIEIMSNKDQRISEDNLIINSAMKNNNNNRQPTTTMNSKKL